jgi:ParB family chromosome partitioning protein
MAKESFASKMAGIGTNLVIKERDPKSAPRTAPGRLMEFSESASEWQEQVKVLKEQLKAAGQGTKKVSMDKLHKVSGRQRQLTPEAYQELKENLRSNALIEPIVVELRPDGDWDILSGNNRFDIGKELGWLDVAIYEVEIEAGKGDAIAFYANLIKSTLSDFEKYQGIKRRMQETGMNNQEMAKESGLTKQFISSLMAFDKLPNDAIAALMKNPKCLGSKAAESFARLTEEGRAEQVIKAIIELSENDKLTQEKAVASAEPKATPITKENIKPKQHKIGKSNFASVRGVEKTIRISFESELDRVNLELAINSLIENHIQSIKK